MFDERWPVEAEELAEALEAVLAKYCRPDILRAIDVEDRAAVTGEHLEQLDQALRQFGLWELPADPYLLTRATISLGFYLAPVPFASAASTQLVLRENGIANGIDRSVVPAGLPRVAVSFDGGIGICATPDRVRRSAAGESVVLVESCVGDITPVEGDVDALRAWGFLLESARLVGAAQSLIRYCVGYVSDRRQFGVPVGSFQGVAHPLAEAATAVAAADLLTRHAVYLADCDGALPMSAAVMAAAKSRAASRQAAATVHQALGGYGFTIESDCQLYSRRIRAWTAAMPDPGPWLAELARTLADPDARESVTDLWQFDRGFTLPRWAGENR
ncbi:MAG: acyl-CoA dehydrogenase family protein [Terrimesophilobacter sp.]